MKTNLATYRMRKAAENLLIVEVEYGTVHLLCVGRRTSTPYATVAGKNAIHLPMQLERRHGFNKWGCVLLDTV